MKADVVVIGGGDNGLTAAALPGQGRARSRWCWSAAPSSAARGDRGVPSRLQGLDGRPTAGPLPAELVGDLGLAVQARVLRAGAAPLRARAGRPRLRSSATRRRTRGRDRPLLGEGRRRASPSSTRSLARLGARARQASSTQTPPDIDAAPGSATCSRWLGWASASAASAARTPQACCAGGRWRSPISSAEWFETELLRAVVAARGICGRLRRAVVGGHDRAAPAATAAPARQRAPARPCSSRAASARSRTPSRPRPRRHGADDPHRRRGRAISVEGRPRHRRRAAGRRGDRGRAPSSRASTRSGRSCACWIPRCSTPTTCGACGTTARRAWPRRSTSRSRACRRSRLSRTDGTSALRGRIHIGPSIDDLERAFDDGKYGGISKKPWIDVTIPTFADPALAPAGQHVMSVYVQYTPYRAARREAGRARETRSAKRASRPSRRTPRASRPPWWAVRS